MRRAQLLAATLSAAAIAGCGGSGHVDPNRVESLIKSQFATVEGVPVRAVTCPAGQPNRAGITFRCQTGTLGQAPVEVVVRVAGHNRFVFTPALAAGRVESALVRGPFARSVIHTLALEASCPDGVPYKPGATMTCQVALAGGQRIPVLVRQTDGQGGVSFSAEEIVAARLEHEIAAKLRGSEAGSAVSCPSGVAIRPGRTLTCSIADSRRSRVKVTIVNRAGDVRFRVPRPPAKPRRKRRHG